MSPQVIDTADPVGELAERPLHRLASPAVSLSELVLVDQYAPQGRRVRQDERLDQLFEERCDWHRRYGRPGQLAVDSGDLSLTYDQLDRGANQLARYLRLHGTNAGDRVALLFDRPVDGYVAMLAALKIGATYVPMDVGFPTDRLAFIVADAQVRTVLTMSSVAERVGGPQALTAAGAELVYLDQAAPLIAEQDTRRLIDAERGVVTNPLAYVVYTPGADGELNGVAVEHPSICNFVKVAAEVYGMRPRDRVYQGLPLAFDFAVEEIWVPWFLGATLVPRPTGTLLTGRALHAFLAEHRVTAMCCVPSLLATLGDDLPELPDLRFLLVSGEPGPPALVSRWYRPGRRLLNVYGPAEATVSTTWTELRPDKPVTAGVPLPTYSTVVLDVADPYRALPHGDTGEIGIAGIGLALGYLNRDDLTEQAFIPDFLGIPGNPSGRIYRTGDLGRVNGDGELEYLGRIDPTGHARGYRLGLADIESVLLPTRSPGASPTGIDNLVAPTIPLAPAAPAAPPAQPAQPAAPPAPAAPAAAPVGRPDQVAETERALAGLLAEVLGVESVPPDSHFFDDLGADSMLMARFCARVRKHPTLPPVAMQDIYRHPSITGLVTALAPAAPPASAPAPAAAPVERDLAVLLAEVLGVESVPPDSHFFDDLGADSMLMARFCARVRKHPTLPPVAMQDIYRHPTVTALAEAFAAPASPAGQTATLAAVPARVPAVALPAQPPIESVKPVGTAEFVLCGALQALFFLGYSYLAALVLVRGYEWVAAGTGLLDIYLRSVTFGAAGFAAASVLPVLVKWLLVGRWQPQEFRVWSLAYVRFWVVKTLIRTSPMVRFVGSPLYLLHLRALGAKIGPGVAVFARTVPACPDLLTVGAGTVIRKDATISCYRALAGLIQLGPVTLGRDVVVGEAAVLDVGTSMGDGAQLGHASALYPGQAVPAGERWHGSPGRPTDVDYRGVEGARPGLGRRFLYPLAQLVVLLAVVLPSTLGGSYLVFTTLPRFATLLRPPALAFTTWAFYREALAASYLLFVGAVLAGLVVMFLVPRLLNLFVVPDKVYRLYGFHYWVHRTITRLTNRSFYTRMFGDSSYIVGYLRGLGYRLRGVQQTGSNFGTEVKQDNPFLSSAGSGTVIADGLSVVNTSYSSGTFRVSRTSIGAHNFLGNRIVYPSGGRTGDNCLLATKVLVPIDGEVREGVGLLGSPSFEIPRTVERDNQLDVKDPARLSRLLASKNRHNLVTIGLYLLVRWIYLFAVLVIELVGVHVEDTWGVLAIALANVVVLLFTVGYYVLVDRLFRGLMALRPTGCSIYDPAFWRHERFWKVCADQYLHAFNGTPFKNVLWRLLGVRFGRRVFDDGAFFTERRFVTIGDHCTLNAGSVVQCHSQEDGAFKSDHSAVGAGGTLGVNAFVHYGVMIGQRAVLAADSFLMKGEEIPDGARWGGNPAREIRS